jgi:hypothetical protein
MLTQALAQKTAHSLGGESSMRNNYSRYAHVILTATLACSSGLVSEQEGQKASR